MAFWFSGQSTTRIRTPKNEDVVVPNSMILGGEVVNFSTLAKSRGLILHTTVGIGYETPWRQVEAMLLMAAERTDGLLREPAPFVLLTIKNAKGEVVRRLRAKAKKGLHRVAWDLRRAAPHP